MNSSLLLWHTNNHTLHILYTYLESHYDALSNVIYKFDHYLEMMLYKHLHRPGSVKPPVLHTPYITDSIVNNQYYMSITSFTNGTHRDGHTVPVAPSDVVQEDNCMMTASFAIRCCYFQDYSAGKIIDYFEFVAQGKDSLEAASVLENTLPVHPLGTAAAPLATTRPVSIRIPPAIICFPLKPKPHQLLDEAFVREYWLGEEAVIV